MEKNLLIKYIDNYNSLKKNESLKIKEQIEKYPFSSILKILYTKYLTNNSLDYKTQLSETAIYVSDRSNLKNKIFSTLIQTNEKDQKMTFDEWIIFLNTKNEEINEEIKIDFVTEKLAKIYIKQKQYNLAIKTYRKLMLKFPKKSILFANQIDKIKQK